MKRDAETQDESVMISKTSKEKNSSAKSQKLKDTRTHTKAAIPTPQAGLRGIVVLAHVISTN